MTTVPIPDYIQTAPIESDAKRFVHIHRTPLWKTTRDYRSQIITDYWWCKHLTAEYGIYIFKNLYKNKECQQAAK